MTRIRLAAGSDPAQAVETVRTTLEARGYHWEQAEGARAVASEGGRPVSGWGTALSSRLRLGIRIEGESLRIDQETHGSVMTGASGSPFLQIKLGRRFSKLLKEICADLQAAGMMAPN